MFAADSEFPGRNIDFIIPKAPGGGFDNLVRVIAPALEKFLPRKVNVVPDNIPAGGGGKGIGQLYRARPDGYTIGAVDIPGSFILQERQKQSGSGFDLSKITWLCAMGLPEYFCLGVGANSPLKSLDDLKALSRTRAVKFTSSGPEGTRTLLNPRRCQFRRVGSQFHLGLPRQANRPRISHGWSTSFYVSCLSDPWAHPRIQEASIGQPITDKPSSEI
jgi:tripartite-type tricarboxylate transporter receptor subunit TctC